MTFTNKISLPAKRANDLTPAINKQQSAVKNALHPQENSRESSRENVTKSHKEQHKEHYKASHALTTHSSHHNKPNQAHQTIHNKARNETAALKNESKQPFKASSHILLAAGLLLTSTNLIAADTSTNSSSATSNTNKANGYPKWSGPVRAKVNGSSAATSIKERKQFREGSREGSREGAREGMKGAGNKGTWSSQMASKASLNDISRKQSTDFVGQKNQQKRTT